MEDKLIVEEHGRRDKLFIAMLTNYKKDICEYHLQSCDINGYCIDCGKK